MIRIKFRHNLNYAGFVFLFLLTIFISCSDEKDTRILARIGEAEITVDEFLNRSELTPRPFYCRSDAQRDKIIILNSLIIEKIFALEERPKSKLLEKPQFNAYIKGRKEQYMREKLFQQMAVGENQLDSAEIQQAFMLAGFIYDVAFYQLDERDADNVTRYMQAHPDQKDSLFQRLGDPQSVPRHRLKFHDPEYPSLQHTFYDFQRTKGEIVGPVRLRETKYMILKVQNVLYEPAMSQTEIVLRRQRVKEKLIEKKTNENWNKFTANLMKGRKIQFYPEMTTKVAELWSKRFIQKNNVKQISPDSDKNVGRFIREVDLLSAEPMFKVDDKVWTVGDFKTALSSHPLVFRKADLEGSEFVQQFRLAVADLVQDVFVTREAYAQNLDNAADVKRNVAMWEDAYLALEHRTSFLNSAGGKMTADGKSGNYHHLADPYINDLVSKYRDQFQLDVNLFKSIKLTHTDMISVQQFVPYTQIVPQFPFLTRTDQLGISAMLN